VVAALAVLAAALGWLAHDSVDDLGSAAFWTVMASLLTVIINYQRRTNRDLQVAREEIARLAVEAERLRFARDLHDLLGHDLARIALQSEVAEALAPTAVDQAIAVMREVGSVARTALHEVRAAVAGYRQPTLASELRGAGELLAAAGIAYRCEDDRVPLPPAVEATLAWAVREGVTNVVKHSRARNCTIRVTNTGGFAGVEVIDDGHGASMDGSQPSPSVSGGSGLAGLAERAAALGGRCEAGPFPGGGFSLSVILPVSKQAIDGATISDVGEQDLIAPVSRRS
jgi:two-component system sensor histidine kinase DesK